ncbi:MAG: pseudaminic acid cytidylyltransferase [Aeromonadales bacterium]|nr:pseudaminic acid cytidylyltransferase [Aeromonadales bacterium]
MNNIAVIPARGGSKRIPYKNIKDFLGKPLICYTIQAALDSGIFSSVVVSTDDEDIMIVSEKSGARVPFMRDKKLADDFTGTYDVVKDAYFRLTAMGEQIDNVCCIYATAPLLTGNHLKKAYDKFVTQNADSLISVCEFSFPIQRAFIINAQGNIAYREPQYAMTRSQDLEPCYQDCGQFYFYKDTCFTQGKFAKQIAYQMPRYRVIDIDTLEDFDYAKAIYKTIEELKLE